MPYDEMQQHLIAEIKDFFKLKLGRPEILNRIGDNFVVFDFIRDHVAVEILKSQLKRIQNNLLRTNGIHLSVSESAIDTLKTLSFGNLENGGRGIGNIVETVFINPLSRYIFDNRVDAGDLLTVCSIENQSGVVTLECKVEKHDD